MKKLLLSLTILLTLSCCKTDDDDNATLPEATQTGAGIFACKVNGQSFIDTSGSYFNCYYQYISGEYYFGISGSDTVESLISVTIGTYNKEIFENETFLLIENISGNAWAGSSFNPNSSSQEFSTTNSQYSGELTITKLDFTNNIVSGTFWFDVENPYTGETVEIREGRFDTLFTQ
ncbi:DUF6252 family protein [Winogradskyella endarachnes]|uniref:Lipoprotein n=1 Tax=Winogradskyella endarachnes TaxID=2681965 RepID=A0A6L6UGJ0_9FLAO|nr:DUF6252 family protein [Winogradskyella endarachnes]MUU79884.1 hypothetical protein [Winogradskyella endarachnes]